MRTSATSLLLALLLFGGLQLLCPASAHAQGGVPLWTNRYDTQLDYQPFPRVAVDGSGNVFVTGYSLNADTNNDYVTIKYSNTGVSLWTNYYDGSAHGDDYAVAIAADSDGSVFVTGRSAGGFLTIKYSNSGIPLWTNRFNAPAYLGATPRAMTVDRNGNIFVTGDSGDGTQTDFATVAYSNNGFPLWTNFYSSPANLYDEFTFVSADSDGNAFVTGRSYSSVFPSDINFATIKYSSAGDLLWINIYDGVDQFGFDRDSPNAMAVDGSGNVFVVGSTSNGTNVDYAIVAYSNDGVPLWIDLYNGPANDYDNAQAIAVDNDGNVFVSGQSWNANRYEMATIKYSGDGVRLWTRRYKGPGAVGSADRPLAIAVDSRGNVFVTGESSTASGSADYATIAYSNSGLPLWTNRYSGPANGLDVPNAIALDRNGNVFVTGKSINTNGNYDIVTIKYSSSVPPPRLDFQKLNNELVLSWTNAGFHLQTAPAVTGPFTNLPAATSPYTNALTAPQQFFRLAQ